MLFEKSTSPAPLRKNFLMKNRIFHVKILFLLYKISSFCRFIFFIKEFHHWQIVRNILKYSAICNEARDQFRFQDVCYSYFL